MKTDDQSSSRRTEPTIAVGLLQDRSSISFRLTDTFKDESGSTFPAGDYRVTSRNDIIRCVGVRSIEAEALILTPTRPDTGRFSLEATIGIEFHWQQDEVQTFSDGLRIVTSRPDRLTAINDVALETYIASVICSEMDAASPLELIKAHSVVSRSWLLAQTNASKNDRQGKITTEQDIGERIHWYDREAHKDFDVCADDHCQRYHGMDRISSPNAHRAIRETRGRVLTFERRVCDARYGKCCGGVTEDFRVAWADELVPYLVPVFDGADEALPSPPLCEEESMRAFLDHPPDVYCNCTDESILRQILTPHDRETLNFFRWKKTLGASQASGLVADKLGVDLGRIVALEPVERGLSGRLKRLKLVGDEGSLVIGKELEIRRALSPSHLLSSAFVVDVEGPDDRPNRFVLRGAGWGHGVGLCQIGAAVMAWQGRGHEEILSHYYPGAELVGIYD
jgi:peptidoglycan hydrolase-like amidase